jgi:RNA polymerase sigma-70 factor (ECF subfamily)
VKHTALALKRKRRRMNSMPHGDEEGPEIPIPSKPEALDPATARGEVALMLQGLSDAHREIVLMRFVDDMTLEEIAEAISIPLGTAKSRLHHALAALRDDPRFRRVQEM